MSFLLDSDICSAHIRRPTVLTHRMLQHSGRLHISTVTLAELCAWANGPQAPHQVAVGISELLHDVYILDFDTSCAETFGQLRPRLAASGITAPPMDLLIAVTALTHSLTLVTHNVADFANIPNLRVIDWLTP